MDNCNESICRKCFHSYVCEQFNENKDIKNNKCHFFNDHFVPTADVVEVVRCFQCKHLNQKGICEKFRQRYPFYPENDFYCGYGERKCD